MKGGEEPLRVAIIGAGAAGLTAAHELVRSGVNVDLFEASDRYGGRFWTKTLGAGQFTTQEAGAMRMPPFIPDDQKKETSKEKRQLQVYSGCSLLSHYLNKYKISTGEFPNPGSDVADTGVYYERGKGHFSDEGHDPEMLIWKKGTAAPDSRKIKDVKKKWEAFKDKVNKFVSQYYGTEDWLTMWRGIVSNYYQYTFRDVVLMKPAKASDKNPCYWGGLGMTEEEARIFYVVGAGDGGWGSFFNLSFLYVMRTFVGGFGTDLQVIEGLFEDNEYNPGRGFGETLRDSSGNVIPSPKYLGTSTITDCILFQGLDGSKEDVSLYEKFLDIHDPSHLFLNSPVSEIRKVGDKIFLRVKSGAAAGAREYLRTGIFGPIDGMRLDGGGTREHAVGYDAVIVTVPSHQIGTEVRVEGFDEKTEWPAALEAHLSQAHWEPCCKVFVELKKPYWEDEDCLIPQCISSDSFLHDIYGVKVDQGGDEQTGTLLISYTWWRDATKLVCYEDQELINMAVEEADRMLATCSNLRKKDGSVATISEFVKSDEHGNFKGWVHHWETQKTYKGAACLYDQNTWESTRMPMSYNQRFGAQSGLFLAGESYHVDAGWVEPAFRSAIDATLRILERSDRYDLTAGLRDGFNFARDYIKYDEAFNPRKRDEALAAVKAIIAQSGHSAAKSGK
ncbi:tryptophan 2-monooxygenase [Sneathiella chinensis]|uniref:Tryptophan 2-monooxygenase n=1 Tax=Sneathiella chinensis TaxID=349750 RepID=A0ABQ5U3M3_9PROT|nr:tryptophan 2-monooxygenase [Sneathiella chinensis]